MPPIDIALTNSSILEVSNFNDPVLVGSLNSNIDEQKRIIDYIAFMQARHLAFERISEIIGRMSQLKALSGDVTKVLSILQDLMRSSIHSSSS